MESANIALQRHERDEGLAGITDIEIVSTDVHVIVEAKKGWEARRLLPQLRKYLPSAQASLEGQRSQVRRSDTSKRGILSTTGGRTRSSARRFDGFPIIPLGLTDVTRIARQALRSERSTRPRLFLRELLEYLEGAGYAQSHRDSRVLVVALSSNPLRDRHPVQPCPV